MVKVRLVSKAKLLDCWSFLVIKLGFRAVIVIVGINIGNKVHGFES